MHPRINLANPVIAIASSDEMAIVRVAMAAAGARKKASSSYNITNALRFQPTFDRMLQLNIDQHIMVSAESIGVNAGTLYNRLTTALSYLAERSEPLYDPYRVLKACIKFTKILPHGVSLSFRDLRAPVLYEQKDTKGLTITNEGYGLSKANWKGQLFDWLETGTHGRLKITGVVLDEGDILLIQKALGVMPKTSYTYENLNLEVFVGE